MSKDFYEGFAERYDLFFSKLGEHPPIVIEFYRQLFTQNQVHSVLDCACGTGQDLILFHSLGCEVFGTDISEAMLTQAQKNLAQSGVKASLQKMGYRELHQHLTRQFDAVVCLSTSICEMPNEVEALRAFNSMHRVLRDEGILILTQGTTDKQWNEKPRFIPMVNTRDFSRVCVIDYTGKEAHYNILDIFHGEEVTDFKVWSINYAQMFLKDDLDKLLKASGFRTVDFHGTYQFDVYDKKTSDLLIVVATK